ncbi:unnamed protein product [Acanthoscelides obtectus]|nr:unnamed protein product [Acanthoscelides obtectus]CAK1673885.1 Something about silencing protein 10 [Acanthoscelides obtectus]
MYLLLKASKTANIQNHPVIKRLYQYRQLLLQLEPVFEEAIKPQIELLLQDNEGSVGKEQVKKKATLKLLSNLKEKRGQLSKKKGEGGLQSNRDSISDGDEQDEFSKKRKKSKVRFDLEAKVSKTNKKEELNNKEAKSEAEDRKLNKEYEEDMNDSELSDGNADQENNKSDDKGMKRPINYQIAKNKGLTPYRKKEHRNPRVKHKLKYRKAIIRRKGAVREVRKELKRYDGEISGIKTSVSKSVKIKT